MVKVTFEGDNLSELKESIKAFFAGADGDGPGPDENGNDEPKKRSRAPRKDKEPEEEKISHASIRKYITENDDKRSAAQELLSDWSLDSISDIKPEKLEKFMQKLKEA